MLFIGAEGLVGGSANLARRAGISPIVVGLNVVAFGTSSPEVLVSLKAGLSGQGDLVLGNSIGSNTFNIAFILGLTALICPITVDQQIIKFDASIALAVAILPLLLLLDDTLGRFDGILLLTLLSAYLAANIWMVRHAPKSAEPLAREVVASVTPDKHRPLILDFVWVLGGLGILVLGSNLLIDNAVLIERDLGVSDAVIGLTIIAGGTSMPELATSALAAFRKQPGIAIGNVVGSNIFNILGILGLTGLLFPVRAENISLFDSLFMVGCTVALLPMLYTGRRLIRTEGGLLLVAYGVYLAILWP